MQVTITTGSAQSAAGTEQAVSSNDEAMKTLFCAILAVAVLQFCSAHVRLTYPPARLPNYDFLDNVRTGGPCGVPSGMQ